MKTLFTNNRAKNFNFSMDVLTQVELSLVKGGKEADIWIDPAPRIVPLAVPTISTLTTTSTTLRTTTKK